MSLNRDELIKDLSDVCNRHGVDSESNTPDFILGAMLADVLDSHTTAMNDTIRWQHWKTLDEKLTKDIDAQSESPTYPPHENDAPDLMAALQASLVNAKATDV